MYNILENLKKNLHKKKLLKGAVGSIAVNSVKKYLGIKELNGYLKNNKLFLTTIDHEIKIKIFLNKKDIIGFVNSSLLKLGINLNVADIYIRSIQEDSDEFL